MSFDVSVIWQNWPLLLAGTGLTIVLVVVALAVGIVIGLLACSGVLLGRGVAYHLSVGYIGLFRGLPETVFRLEPISPKFFAPGSRRCRAARSMPHAPSAFHRSGWPGMWSRHRHCA
jgi:hypothetical protein